MKFGLDKSIEILERTPASLSVMLKDLSTDWVMNNEGPETFSPYDVLGHLIHGEKTDWRPRLTMIREHGLSQTFVPYDRFAQYRESEGKSMTGLLEEFSGLRKENLKWLKSLQLTQEDMTKEGMHPVLGKVSMQQLLATWVVHDLTHIAQISRVMAKQYKEEIGPWVEFFRILNF